MTDPKKAWSLDRSISIGDLLVFLSLLFAGIGYVMHQDQRTTRVEESVTNMRETDQRHDRQLQVQKDEINDKLDRLETKLDRLMERK